MPMTVSIISNIGVQSLIITDRFHSFLNNSLLSLNNIGVYRNVGYIRNGAYGRRSGAQYNRLIEARKVRHNGRVLRNTPLHDMSYHGSKPRSQQSLT